MREIKFRAWDKENNRWAYSTEINIEGSGQVIHNHYKAGKHGQDRLIGCGHLEPLQQYTGLKDKNGVEIYEGDIVDFYCRRDYDPTAPFYINRRKRKVVKWISNEHKNAINIRQTADQDVAYHEVIGNIYENPLLLAKDTVQATTDQPNVEAVDS